MKIKLNKLRMQEGLGIIKKTKTKIPLLLDLFYLKKKEYLAINKEGIKVFIRPKSGEHFTFYENLIRKDYLKHGAYMQEEDTVIDIGANIGCFTLLAASILKNSGKVIAIEPDPANFRQLIKNIKINKFSNVIPINAAISDYNGKIKLNYCSKSQLASTIYKLNDEFDPHVKEVDCITFEKVLIENDILKIDFLKIDCEGAEYQLFNSINPLTLKKIKQISMELHGEKKERKKLKRKLIKFGFKIKKSYPFVAIKK